jgi:hypothetical protein
MQRVHIFFGILLAAVFLFSGIYMMSNFPEIYADSPEVRMMFRANHIYILFASLINFLLAIAIIEITKNAVRKAHIISSALILLGGTLLVIAFFVEPATSNWDRFFTFSGIILHAIGISIIVISNTSNKK